MGAVSYVVAKGDLTLSKRESYRRGAMVKGLEFAITKNIGNAVDLARVSAGQDPLTVDIRDLQPTADFAATIDDWQSAVIGVVNTFSTVFNGSVAPALAANKVAVFYKVGIETWPVPVSRLVFRKGAVTGNIIQQFDLEQLVNSQEIEGYFTTPVVYGPTDTVAVTVRSRNNTGLLCRVILGGYIIEPAQLAA